MTTLLMGWGNHTHGDSHVRRLLIDHDLLVLDQEVILQLQLSCPVKHQAVYWNQSLVTLTGSSSNQTDNILLRLHLLQILLRPRLDLPPAQRQDSLKTGGNQDTRHWRTLMERLLYSKWSSLKKRLALSKQRIAPLIQSHSAAIKRDLEVFRSEAKRQHQSFLNSPCLSHNCDSPVAQDLIQEYVQILLGLMTQAKDLMELQELLQSSIVNFSILNQFEDELTNANLLWEMQHVISEYHTNIKTQIWLNVDFSDMKDACREHTALLMSLGDCTRDWDARAYFQEAVYEMQHTIPLLEGLSNKHMRPRHWKQVLRYSINHSLMVLLMKNGTLDMNVLRHMTVGLFMDLKLLGYSADILGIVDRASKEVAIEELLKKP